MVTRCELKNFSFLPIIVAVIWNEKYLYKHEGIVYLNKRIVLN
jgi:hypothetical protein